MTKRNILVVFLAFLGVCFIALFCVYQVFTSPIDKKSTADIEIVIPSGMTTNNISKLLKNKDLIRNDFFFRVFLKLNHISSLKASTYTLQKSMSMNEIVQILESGNHYDPNVINITFKEGENFTDFAQEIAKNTKHSYEEVIQLGKNSTYLNQLIQKYWFLTEEILDPNIYYPLEGYLAPNTYQFKSKEIEISEIFETMLDQREKEMEKLKEKLSTYTAHQYFTIASMLELEGTNSKNRKMIAGIFYNRLANNMNLGSDVTTYYALQVPMTSDLTTNQFNTENPYNTRGPNMFGKLPVGPICNPSISSIQASISPTENDYLFFVADKNGNVFYTKTNEEHLQKVQEIKDKGDWIWQ